MEVLIGRVRVPPKMAMFLIPGICEYAALHEKWELNLQMELRLQLANLEIVRLSRWA